MAAEQRSVYVDPLGSSGSTVSRGEFRNVALARVDAVATKPMPLRTSAEGEAVSGKCS